MAMSGSMKQKLGVKIADGTKAGVLEQGGRYDGVVIHLG